MSIKPEGLTENAWASRIGNRNIFQAIRNGARPRSDTIEKLVAAIEYTPAQFYDLLEGRTGRPKDDRGEKRGLPFQRRDEPKDIALMGTAHGSDFEVEQDGKLVFVERMDLDMENVVDRLRRPISLIGKEDVYAITVVGNSMADRYMDGDPAYVDPKRPAKAGDYVVVQMRRPDGEGERITTALLKQLVRRTSTYIELEQKHPAVRFTIPSPEVSSIHRVIPWAEIVFF